jgi:hypothetical protein
MEYVLNTDSIDEEVIKGMLWKILTYIHLILIYHL